MTSARHLQTVMFHSFRAGDEASKAQIALAARSIREHYPEARIVLLTNPLGAEAGLPDFIDVRPGPVADDEIMFERARRYRDHVLNAEPGAVLVFMDTDMLVVRRFDELLMPGADLSVTVRRLRMAPINGGLIIVDTARRDVVSAFFERFVVEFAALSVQERRWDGDQTILARLLDPPVTGLRETLRESRGELMVRFAPVRIFNNTPRRWLLRLALFRPGVRLLHFKGPRKARMPAYARRFLSPLYIAYARAADRRRGLSEKTLFVVGDGS